MISSDPGSTTDATKSKKWSRMVVSRTLWVECVCVHLTFDSHHKEFICFHQSTHLLPPLQKHKRLWLDVRDLNQISTGVTYHCNWTELHLCHFARNVNPRKSARRNGHCLSVKHLLVGSVNFDDPLHTTLLTSKFQLFAPEASCAFWHGKTCVECQMRRMNPSQIYFGNKAT